MHLAAFAKYPFKLGGSGVYYPLLGVDSQLLLGALIGAEKPFPSDALEDARKQYNSAWIKFGAGLDLNITQKLYFRAQFLYGFKFYNEPERKIWESHKNNMQVYAFHGPTIKLAIGYILYTRSF